MQAGADELLLPMVQDPGEVIELLRLADDRCGVGILIETEEAVAGRESRPAAVARGFVGLNDLSIQRGADSIFDAVRDGTVERVCGAFDAPIGFAGLTLPDVVRPCDAACCSPRWSGSAARSRSCAAHTGGTFLPTPPTPRPRLDQGGDRSGRRATTPAPGGP